MRIGEFDIPEELLAAQRSGRLVIFAGAGVSMGPPANYPDFRGLVRKIGKGSTVKPDSADEPSERYLGRLESTGVKVHEIARQLLRDPKSKPNALHSSLVRLFGGNGGIRIVTTNCDAHFTAESPTGTEVYKAPALPVGSNFEGLVYLHGSVDGPPNRLVLTDCDFGRAYLTEGWARRFLQELYSAYTVLFVGYSHNDPVMIYLTRGLPPGSSRLYALTSNESLDHWRYLGITPIAYPLKGVGDRHAALLESVAVWADRISMRAFDHEDQIQRITSGSPPLRETEDDDYMQSVVQDAEKYTYFVRHATSKDWLIWAEDRGLLSSLFSRRTVQDERLRSLAYWFDRQAVHKAPELALGIFVRQGQVLSQVLWNEIARGFHAEKETDPSSLKKWLPILLDQSTPEESGGMLEYLFPKVAKFGSWPLTLRLFEHLTRPRIRLEKSMSFLRDGSRGDKPTSTEIGILGSHHWMKEAWSKTFLPNLALIAADVVRITSHNIRLAHDLGLCHEVATPNWEPLSFHRSAIEPNKQDDLNHDFDTVIDACRDSLEWLLSHRRRAARGLIEDWLVIPAPILRRIAIHCLRLDGGTPPDRKLRAIIEFQLLSCLAVHHELFLLLRDSYPLSSPITQRAFLSHAREMTVAKIAESPNDDPGIYWHSLFTLLTWLDCSVAGKCQLVKTRLQRLKKKYPSFRVSDHSDFTHWSGGVQNYAPESPVSTDDLLAKSPKQVAHLLVTFKETDRSLPNRDGLLAALTSAVKKDTAWAVRVAKALPYRSTITSDILAHFFWGWRDAEFAENQWTLLLKFIDKSPRLLKCDQGAASLLEQGVRREKNRIPESLMPLAEQVGVSVWSAAERNVMTPREDSTDWLSIAINSSGGKLAEFFVAALSIRRKCAGAKWKGIPVELRSQFERIVLSQSYAGEMGRVILASQLHFLYSCDSRWTKRRVLPLLFWRSKKRPAIQAWHGFAFWGRWSEELLPELLPLYEQCFNRLSTDLKPMRERIVEHIASICLFSSRKQVRGRWLHTFLRSVTVSERTLFAESVRKILWDLDSDKTARIWRGWLRLYWAERLIGKPVPLEREEASKMVEWAPHLRTVFPEVVQLISETRLDFKVADFIYHLLAEKGLPATYPVPTSQLLQILTKTSYQTMADYGDLPKIIRELAKEPATHVFLRDVLDQMAMKGSQVVGELRAALSASVNDAKDDSQSSIMPADTTLGHIS